MKNRSIFGIVIIALVFAALAGSAVAQTQAKMPVEVKRDGKPLREIEKVRGDVVIGKGQTVKEATAVMGDVTVYGHVTGDASAVMGDVYIRRGGRVDGDATAVAGKVVKDSDAVVGGSITSVSPHAARHGHWRYWATWCQKPNWWWIYLGLVLSRALLAAIVVALFPGRMAMVANTSYRRAGWSFLYGLIGLMLIIPVAILLAITCVGIPLIPVEILFVFVAWIAGDVGVAMAIGQTIASSLHKVLAAVIGTIILGLVDLIPFAGYTITLVLSLIGLGAVFITGFGSGSNWFSDRFSRRPVVPATAAAGE